MNDILEHLYLIIPYPYSISIALHIIIHSTNKWESQVSKSLLSFLQERKPRFRKSVYSPQLALDARLSVMSLFFQLISSLL